MYARPTPLLAPGAATTMSPMPSPLKSGGHDATIEAVSSFGVLGVFVRGNVQSKVHTVGYKQKRMHKLEVIPAVGFRISLEIVRFSSKSRAYVCICTCKVVTAAALYFSYSAMKAAVQRARPGVGLFEVLTFLFEVLPSTGTFANS